MLKSYLYMLSQDDTSSSINRVKKAMVFKKLLSNKHLQEAALVFTTSSKSREEKKSAEKKQCRLFSRTTSTILSISLTQSTY